MDAPWRGELSEQLQTISLPERYTDWMLKQVEKEDKETVSAHQSEIQHLSERIKADEERMEKLVSLYLDGDIPKEAYLTKKDKLMRSLAASRSKMKDVTGGRNNRNEPLQNWILDLKQADVLASSDDLPKLKQFVLKVGTNPTLDDKSPCFSVATPFQFVASRRGFLPACVVAAPSARLTSVLSEQEVSICGERGIRTLEGFRLATLAVWWFQPAHPSLLSYFYKEESNGSSLPSPSLPASGGSPFFECQLRIYPIIELS